MPKSPYCHQIITQTHPRGDRRVPEKVEFEKICRCQSTAYTTAILGIRRFASTGTMYRGQGAGRWAESSSGARGLPYMLLAWACIAARRDGLGGAMSLPCWLVRAGTAVAGGERAESPVANPREGQRIQQGAPNLRTQSGARSSLTQISRDAPKYFRQRGACCCPG